MNWICPSPEKTKTMHDVLQILTETVGAEHSIGKVFDRQVLFDLIPTNQDELPSRTMKDSWDCAVIPLGSDEHLREKYISFVGGVRVGRLLEDLDIFAVWLCYKHILNPRQKPDMPSPYCIVTALVDRIDFDQCHQLRPDRDVRLSGHVSWVGRSSIEAELKVEQWNDEQWQKVTRAVFVMVARDPLNKGSAIVNPLLCETNEEKQIFNRGEMNRRHRKIVQDESLFNVPPSETEKTIIHDMFMTMASPGQLSYAPKNVVPNSTWMEETKLKNLIICHPEHRNRFKKIFGGYIMRQAFELGWAAAYTYSKMRPQILHIDDIMFRSPVEIGSLLYLNAQVVYTEGNHVQVSTKASVVDVTSSTSNLTNVFHFTFGVDRPVSKVLPHSYHEAMMYLDGRRHYQIVRGITNIYDKGAR